TSDSLMARKLRLTLGNVEAVVELSEVDAPESSKLLWGLLPLEQRARHSMENGREVYLLLDPKTEIPDENQTIYQTVGDVLLYYKPSAFVEPNWTGYANQMPVLSWVYERDTAIMGTYGPIATNVVGTITEGLGKLQTEAPRMRREGMGSMRFSPIG
ncbi:MAG: DUF3830 family protein, partial [Thaumarchaeota archaeon]|nr:DUF3830 family protein [Nitrososphaerota archaeon]